MSAYRPLRPDPSLRQLNQPKPLKVVLKGGEPSIVQRDRRGVGVVAVRDMWRIDDRWWTESPVSRMYYELELPEGEVLTVFHDLVADLWYEQQGGGG